MNLLTIITPLGTLEGLLIPSAVAAASDSTVHHSEAAAKVTEVVTQKFWMLETLWQWIREIGVGPRLADAITFSAACALLVAMVWLVDLFLSRVVIIAIKTRVTRSKTSLDDILFERKFFTRLFNLIPLMVILVSVTVFFQGFDPWFLLTANLAVKSALIFTVMMIIYSVLDSMNDAYLNRPEARQKSITGYIQVGKIVVGFMAIILIIATLMQKDPTTLFVGLGAAAAILSLVFKDTILGFVASIQLSAQDMVRPGDWIEMPSKKADGTVVDINVNSVKVRNWDNTITMIPIYSMVSESFINWRGMEQSGGRRFVRHFFIDITSVMLADEVTLKRLSDHPVTGSWAEATLELARKSSPAALSNMSLFRAHLEVYLFRNPLINHELLTYARYLPDITEKGVGLEIYAFSKEKSSYDFDAVHRGVVEYVVSVAPIFGVRLFQNPSGADVSIALRRAAATSAEPRFDE